MMKVISAVSFLLAVITVVSCGSCSNPELSVTSFTTQDATVVTNIAYIGEFSIKCGSGIVSNLYADIDGVISPVANVGNNKFQVSWTEDIQTARSGDRVVRIFDEEGFAAVRKAIRGGENINSVSPLVNVIINHPGAFQGPWLKSEFMAAALSVIVAYIAFSSRSKLLY